MYRLLCFGAAAVVDKDVKPVSLRSRKHLALLLYLRAHAGLVVDRDRVLRMFWPAADSSARHSLSQAVYDIRSHIPGIQITSTKFELGIAPKHLAYAGTELESAVAKGDYAQAMLIFKGEFAPNLIGTASPAFDKWLEHESDRYRVLGCLALKHFIGRAEASGEWGAVCVGALRLTKIAPFDEDAHYSLARALWLVGDTPSAQRLWSGFEARLRDELQRSPRRTLEDVATRLEESFPATVCRSNRSKKLVPSMVGRKQELAQLLESMRRAKTGDSCHLLVVGGIGVGKSRFLDEAARIAHVDGLAWVRSHCPERREQDEVPGAGRAKRLVFNDVSWRDGPRTSDLTSMWNAVRCTEEGDTLGNWRRLLSVFRLRSRAAGLVWLIDDAQWITQLDKKVVGALVQSLAGERVLLVTAMRLDCATRDGRAGRSTIGDVMLPRFRTIVLTSLDVDAARQLVGKCDGELVGTATVEYIVRQSGGNPRFVCELVASATAARQRGEAWRPLVRPSQDLRASLDLQLSGLGRRDWQVLTVIALLGERASMSRLAKLSMTNPLDFSRELECLERRGLVLLKPDGVVAFTHGIVGDYVVSRSGALSVAAIHLAIAHVLSEEDDIPSDALSYHYIEGGDRREGYRLAIQSAEEALRRGDYEKAMKMARLAESVAATASRGRDASRIALKAAIARGELAGALEILRETRRVDADTRSAELIWNGIQRVRAELEMGELVEARMTLGQLLSYCRPLHRPEEMVALATLAVRLHLASGTQVKAKLWQARLGRLLEKKRTQLQGAATEREAIYIQACFAAFHGSTKEAKRYLARLAKQAGGGLETELRLHLARSVLYVRRADWDRADAVIQKGLRAADAARDLLHAAHFRTNAACLALEVGDWEKARTYSAASIDIYRQLRFSDSAIVPALFNRACALFYSGYASEAAKALGQLEEIVATPEGRPEVTDVKALRGLLAAMRGQLSKVVECATELTQRTAEPVASFDRYRSEWFISFLLLQQGFGDVAVSRLKRAIEEEKERDVRSAMKLSWLVPLFKHDAVEQAKLREALGEAQLGWFCVFSRRWLRLASQHNWQRLPKGGARYLEDLVMRERDGN